MNQYALGRRGAVLAIGLGYAFWAVVSVVLSRQPGSLAVLWFANAWAVGVLLCRPSNETPRLLAVQALANSVSSLWHGDSLALLIAFSACNVAETAAAVLLLSRNNVVSHIFDSPAQFLKSLALGAVLPSIVGATLGSVVLSYAGLASIETVWTGWFLGVVYGYLTFLPLIGLFTQRRTPLTRLSCDWRKLLWTSSASIATYLTTRWFSHPYSITLGLMLVALIAASPSEAALAIVGSAVVMAYMKSVHWAGMHQAGLKPDLIQELLPMIAVLLGLGVLLAFRRSLGTANQRLTQNEHFIRSLTDVIPGMVGYWDTRLRNRFANAAYRDWFGWSPNEIAGQHVSELLGAELYGKNRPFMEAALRGERQKFARNLTKTDGTTHHSLAEYIPDIRNGEVQGFVVLVTDVTEIEKAKLNALKANQAKSAFLATMSHEIRTPLNAIIGTSYLLSLDSLTEKQREDLATISASSKNLLALINDVLDFSKIEAGEFELEQQPFLLSETLADVRAMFSTLAIQKGLQLEVGSLPQRISSVVMGDSNRLKQILINLINNAVKFTSAGQIRLSVAEYAPAHEGVVHVRFMISDTGIGMSPEALDKLFKPFVQAESSVSRKYGGTGLGLSIVKRLTELMGGQVKVTSTEGQGSTFTVDLPFALSEAGALRRQSHFAAPRALQVLVAEEDPTERQMLMRACSAFSWNVEGVDNGMAVIELVTQRIAGNNPIDCIVLDWHLLQLDGLAVLRELKQRLGTTPMPPVIMVTAEDSAAFRRTLNESHPDAILTKPVDPSILFNSVNEAVVAHGHDLSQVFNATHIEGGRIRWLDSTRIMVVDDSQMNLEVIRRILSVEGAEAILCKSGQAALDLLESGLAVDLLLMDLQMPDMDGCETTLNIRRHITGALPIIALTAGATTSEKDRAMASGMNGFLTKPVDPIILVRVLREHIEHVRGKPLAVQVMPAATPAQQESGWPGIAGIDSEMAKAIMGGDVEFFENMLEKFRSEHRNSLSALKELLANEEREPAGKLAHKLAGQAGNIGATALHEAAKALEDALLDGGPDLIMPLSALEKAYRQLF